MAADPRQRAFLAVLDLVHRRHLVGVAGVRQIWIVRHADAYASMPALDVDFDPELSPSGRVEAAHLAARLGRTRFDRIHSSPLRRAMDTARMVHLEQPQAQFMVDPDLREVATDWERGGTGRRQRRGVYPFAEAEPDVVARAVVAVAALASGLEPGGRGLLLSHSGWIGTYLAHLLGLSFTRLHWLPRFTSVSVVVTDGERYVVRSMGDATHLEDVD